MVRGVSIRFEGKDYGCLNASDTNKGPCPQRIWFVHCVPDLDTASGSRKAFPVVKTADVWFISTV